MRAAVDFYRRLGLDVPDTLPEWQAHHRTLLHTGDVEVELDSAGSPRTGTRAGRPAAPA